MTLAWRDARDRFDDGLAPALVRDLWRGDPASLRLISKDYNIVYRFEAGGGFYLRVCHEALHPLPKARQVMGFLRYLADNEVPVGVPLASVNGEFIEALGGGYFASAQREAPGDLMTLHMRDISVYEAWGESLGKLHAASRRYEPEATIDYEFPTVQRFWQNIAPAVARMSPELRRIYADLSEWMEALPRHDYGLIHGDYRPGNVLWDGAIARTIDFDEPNFHWYVADVARALMELWEEPWEGRRRYREAFMRGYLREHEIDAAWVDQLGYFAQHRGMLMHAWDLQEGGSGAGSLEAEWASRRVVW